MNLQQPFRPAVEAISKAISDTFDFLMAKMNAVWNVQHNADGTHSAITATGLSVPVNSITGKGTITSDLIPATTDLYRIGGQSLEPLAPIYRWKELWTKSQYWGSTATLTGATAAAWVDSATTNRTTIGQGDATAQKWTFTDANAHDLVIIGGDVTIGGANVTGGVTLLRLVVTGNAEFALGIFERARSARIGEWISPTVTDANFRGSATGDADWVVNVPGDILTFEYMLIGKTMFVVAEILTSDVANAPVSLIADIPGGFTSNKTTDAFCRITDAAVRTTGAVQVGAGGTTMSITRADAVAFTNTGGAGNTAIRWEIFFEVQ